MKRSFQIALLAAIAVTSSGPVAAAEATASLTNQHDKVSYSVGMYVANNFLKRNGLDVDIDLMAQGIKDVLAGRELKVSDQEAQQVLMAYQQELRAKRDQERVAAAEKNRAAGETFLAANKQKPDIKTVEVPMPGVPASATNAPKTAELQYKVVAEGSGESPSGGTVVAYRLRGTTIEGKEFENTTTQPEPVRTPLNRIPVPGLREAIQMMKPGAKWQVFVPAALGYGDYPGPNNLEPGSALIYDVELVNFESPQPLTSDIIKVPSAEELARGAKIEVIKAEDLKRMQQTNAPAGTP